MVVAQSPCYLFLPAFLSVFCVLSLNLQGKMFCGDPAKLSFTCNFLPGSSLEAVTTCELCKEKLQLNLEDFDIHELHRAHANEQVSIFCLIYLGKCLFCA